jgi:hypothetical protein
MKLSDLPVRIVLCLTPKVSERRKKWEQSYYLKNREKFIARAKKWNKDNAEIYKARKRKPK